MHSTYPIYLFIHLFLHSRNLLKWIRPCYYLLVHCHDYIILRLKYQSSSYSRRIKLASFSFLSLTLPSPNHLSYTGFLALWTRQAPSASEHWYGQFPLSRTLPSAESFILFKALFRLFFWSHLIRPEHPMDNRTYFIYSFFTLLLIIYCLKIY